MLSAVPTLGVLVLPMRFGDPVVGLSRRYSPRKPGGRLPTLRSPTHLGVPFKLFWCYYAQRRAGCLRSGPSSLRGCFIYIIGVFSGFVVGGFGFFAYSLYFFYYGRVYKTEKIRYNLHN
jgi:hypothetical protein